MAKDIRLIALDLDGTLLTTDKRLTERNRNALLRAWKEGIAIVPVTGRIFNGLPRSVLELPCLKYAILCNGASVYDVAGDRLLCRAEMPLAQALEIMSWLDEQPVIYDCYAEGRGFMTEAMWNQIDRYAWSPIVVDYMKSIRTPVPELKACYVVPLCQGVQQIFSIELTLDDQKEHQAKQTPALATLLYVDWHNREVVRHRQVNGPPGAL